MKDTNDRAGGRQPGILCTNQRLVYANRFLELFDDEVLFPGGTAGTYVRAEWKSPFGVAVLATTDDGSCVLVRQYNYASSAFMLQVPKGMAEDNESPLAAARRELREETGYKAREWREVQQLVTDPSFSRHIVHIFHARGAHGAYPPAPEATETIAQVEVVPRTTIGDTAWRSSIVDAITQFCLLTHIAAEA